MSGKRKKGKRKSKTPAPVTAPPPVDSRAYEAAISTPARRHVIGADGSADLELDGAQSRLVAWGRYLDENHDLAHGVLDDIVQNVVGSGIVTIPAPLNLDGSINEALGAEILKVWRPWTRRADVTGELSNSDAQRIMCRSWVRDGEQFVQHVQGRDRGYPFSSDDVPYRLELLESEMCPYDLLTDGWRQGVRHDAWRRPLQYAIYLRHPSELGYGFAGAFTSVTDFKTVPAEQVTHLKVAKRWPATRGVSIFASVITRLYDIKDLEESERIKNRVLASWCAAIQKSPDVPGAELADSQGRRYLEMSGGTLIDTLAPGETIVGVGPEYPIANMPDHIADQLRRISAGTGTRYSSISRRYDGNYAAQRQEMVESQGRYDMRRDAFVETVCRTVYERWLIAAVLDGKITVPMGVPINLLANAEYRGPAVPWIDPLKEVQADIAAIDANLIDREQVQIKRGMRADRIGSEPERREPAQLSLIPPPDEDEDEAA